MQRHDLIRVAPPDWQVMLACHPGLQDLPLVPAWAEKGWPVIIRRRIPGDEAESIPAALPLPPCFGKRRVGFSFGRETKYVAVPPLTLADAAAIAPSAWRPAIAALLALGRIIGTTPHVFGGLLWEKMTGIEYLAHQSDLDLLWRPADEAAAARLLAGLLQIDGKSPVRIDGELELPDGAAVNWRELAACGADRTATILVKSMEAVTVRCVAHLFEPATCGV
jgi:phosphoribosyl-dephospho-CoA transferase